MEFNISTKLKSVHLLNDVSNEKYENNLDRVEKSFSYFYSLSPPFKRRGDVLVTVPDYDPSFEMIKISNPINIVF